MAEPRGTVDLIENLPTTLRAVRKLRGLSIRQAAAQMGVSFSTVHRIEAGDDYVVSNLVAALRWIGGKP